MSCTTHTASYTRSGLELVSAHITTKHSETFNCAAACKLFSRLSRCPHKCGTEVSLTAQLAPNWDFHQRFPPRKPRHWEREALTAASCLHRSSRHLMQRMPTMMMTRQMMNSTMIVTKRPAKRHRNSTKLVQLLLLT